MFISCNKSPSANQYWSFLTKTLAVSRLENASIPATPIKVSYQKFPTTEIVPGILNDDDYLFSSYINGGSHLTTFVCHFCYDDYSFKSADSIRFHIQTEHGLEMHHRLKIKPPYEPEFEELNMWRKPISGGFPPQSYQRRFLLSVL